MALLLAQPLLATSHRSGRAGERRMARRGGEIEERVAIAQEPGIADRPLVELGRNADLRCVGRAAGTLQYRGDPLGWNHHAAGAFANRVPALGETLLQLRLGFARARFRREFAPARRADLVAEPALQLGAIDRRRLQPRWARCENVLLDARHRERG